jgi:hypothetical protein
LQEVRARLSFLTFNESQEAFRARLSVEASLAAASMGRDVRAVDPPNSVTPSTTTEYPPDLMVVFMNSPHNNDFIRCDFCSGTDLAALESF